VGYTRRGEGKVGRGGGEGLAARTNISRGCQGTRRTSNGEMGFATAGCMVEDGARLLTGHAETIRIREAKCAQVGDTKALHVAGP